MAESRNRAHESEFTREERSEELSDKEQLDQVEERFLAEQNESLQRELLGLVEVVRESYGLREEKSGLAKQIENIRKFTTGLLDKRVATVQTSEDSALSKVLKFIGIQNREISVGDLCTAAIGWAIAAKTSTTAKAAFYSATGIGGAAASLAVGGILGGIRAGISTERSISKQAFSGESWRAQISEMPDEPSKLRAIELLLKDPDFKKHLKATPSEAIDLIILYQETAGASDNQEMIEELLADKSSGKTQAMSEVFRHIENVNDFKKKAIIRAVGRGALRGAIFGLAGYGAAKTLEWLGGFADKLDGNNFQGSQMGMAGEAGQGAEAGASHAPEATPDNHFTYRVGTETGHHLEIDNTTGKFLEGSGQEAIVKVDDISGHEIKGDLEGATPWEVAKQVTDALKHDNLISDAQADNLTTKLGDLINQQHTGDMSFSRDGEPIFPSGTEINISADTINEALGEVKFNPDGIAHFQAHDAEVAGGGTVDAPEAPTGEAPAPSTEPGTPHPISPAAPSTPSGEAPDSPQSPGTSDAPETAPPSSTTETPPAQEPAPQGGPHKLELPGQEGATGGGTTGAQDAPEGESAAPPDTSTETPKGPHTLKLPGEEPTTADSKTPLWQTLAKNAPLIIGGVAFLGLAGYGAKYLIDRKRNTEQLKRLKEEQRERVKQILNQEYSETDPNVMLEDIIMLDKFKSDQENELTDDDKRAIENKIIKDIHPKIAEAFATIEPTDKLIEYLEANNYPATSWGAVQPPESGIERDARDVLRLIIKNDIDGRFIHLPLNDSIKGYIVFPESAQRVAEAESGNTQEEGESGEVDQDRSNSEQTEAIKDEEALAILRNLKQATERSNLSEIPNLILALQDKVKEKKRIEIPNEGILVDVTRSTNYLDNPLGNTTLSIELQDLIEDKPIIIKVTLGEFLEKAQLDEESPPVEERPPVDEGGARRSSLEDLLGSDDEGGEAPADYIDKEPQSAEEVKNDWLTGLGDLKPRIIDYLSRTIRDGHALEIKDTRDGSAPIVVTAVKPDGGLVIQGYEGANETIDQWARESLAWRFVELPKPEEPAAYEITSAENAFKDLSDSNHRGNRERVTSIISALRDRLNSDRIVFDDPKGRSGFVRSITATKTERNQILAYVFEVEIDGDRQELTPTEFNNLRNFRFEQNPENQEYSPENGDVDNARKDYLEKPELKEKIIKYLHDLLETGKKIRIIEPAGITNFTLTSVTAEDDVMISVGDNEPRQEALGVALSPLVTWELVAPEPEPEPIPTPEPPTPTPEPPAPAPEPPIPTPEPPDPPVEEKPELTDEQILEKIDSTKLDGLGFTEKQIVEPENTVTIAEDIINKGKKAVVYSPQTKESKLYIATQYGVQSVVISGLELVTSEEIGSSKAVLFSADDKGINPGEGTISVLAEAKAAYEAEHNSEIILQKIGSELNEKIKSDPESWEMVGTALCQIKASDLARSWVTDKSDNENSWIIFKKIQTSENENDQKEESLKVKKPKKLFGKKEIIIPSGEEHRTPLIEGAKNIVVKSGARLIAERVLSSAITVEEDAEFRITGTVVGNRIIIKPGGKFESVKRAEDGNKIIREKPEDEKGPGES